MKMWGNCTCTEKKVEGEAAERPTAKECIAHRLMVTQRGSYRRRRDEMVGSVMTEGRTNKETETECTCMTNE